MKRKRQGWLGISAGAVLAFLALLGGIRRQAEAQPKGRTAATKERLASRPESQLQTDRNLGKAYYEQGKYTEALAEFQKVIASGKALATDHLNLGLALMQSNKLDLALGELTTARQMAPKLLAPDYNLGILYKRELHYPDAEVQLKHVTEGDPRDPAAWFNLGEVYFAEAQRASTPQEKTNWLEAALDAELHVVQIGFPRGQNFYVASLFHCFTILVRLGRRAEAQKYLQLHEKVKDAVPGISVQTPALEGGKYGAILVPHVAPVLVASSAGSARLTFSEITSRLGIHLHLPPLPRQSATISSSEYSLAYARKHLVPLFGPSLVAGDYDGDGRPDLYIVNPAGSNRLFHNNGDGTFTDVTAKAGIAGPGGSVSAAFADYDNSGHPSLFVVGLGGVRLYHNNGNGTFTDVTAKAGLSLPKSQAGELDTRAVLFDANNDGFLDLFVTAYTNLDHPPDKSSFAFPRDFAGVSSHYFRNDGDGRFSEMTTAAGFGGAEGRMRDALFADFNNGGYMDLVLFRDDGPPMLFMNRGSDRFVNETKFAGPWFSRSTAFGGHAADFDHDGLFDLALWNASGYTVLRNEGQGRFTPFAGLPAVTPPAGLLAFRGLAADLNGDSFTDLLIPDSAGHWHFIANRAGRFVEAPLSLPGLSAAKLAALDRAWLSGPGTLDLVGLTESGKLAAWEKTGPPARWIEVKLLGSKSNIQGVGDIVEVKAGDFYDKVLARESPVRIYTGNLPKLDVVRVTWPNAIVQNSIDVKTNQTLQVRESERLASSCPFLYVWNGKQFVFYTDVLGASPLGELQPDGTWTTQDPEEWVRLGETPQPHNGFYTFQITDEMREVDYLDRARLLAVDHPAGPTVYSNEIYSSTPVRPAAYIVPRKRFPVSAVDDRGRNVLPLWLAADGQYPADFRLQHILGLANLHSLTLDLGRFPNSSRVDLYLTGWVFWTDSNASRALMKNSELKMVSPYLQVRAPNGEWVTAIPDMGLPSGTRRTMRVDLTGKFLTADHRVRIVTNLCVYWDRIFFSTDDAPAPAPATLPLVSADLHYRGFSTPVSNPRHRRPDNFEYARLLQQAPWDPMRGDYTRYGNVTRLLTRVDDQLVVMAAGDEVTLQFDARALPPLKPGWKRDFFLDLVGYAKDGEPNTADSKTVVPLPFLEMSGYPPGANDRYPSTPDYKRFLQEYETRPGFRLIPPLAPALR